ncbi:MAG: hypothetical protein AAB268_05100 [Elusimicrobiota bacterium]
MPAALILLALLAAAQSPPAASTATPTVSNAKLARRIHAVIHKDAVDWEPLALREGGVPGSAHNEVSLKVVKIKGRMKGENTAARSVARLHEGKMGSRWLAISLYPKAFEGKRTHLELRFRVFEGYVEEVEAAVVTVTDRRRPPSGKLLDSYDLREKGIAYQEVRPGSGEVVVAEFDSRPGASSVNSGRLEKAEFADENLGFVNLSWSVKGVSAVGSSGPSHLSTH